MISILNECPIWAKEKYHEIKQHLNYKQIVSLIVIFLVVDQLKKSVENSKIENQL